MYLDAAITRLNNVPEDFEGPTESKYAGMSVKQVVGKNQIRKVLWNVIETKVAAANAKSAR